MKAHQRAFLAAISEMSSVSDAASAARIDRRQHYRWMADDPTYPPRFSEAWEQGLDLAESEARRRAIEGVEEPVFSGGKRAMDVLMRAGKVVLDPRTKRPIEIPATIRRKSDTLLMFFLNGNRPQKYRNRTDSRFVDKDGDDRQLLDVASVRAYMQAAPRDGESQ